MRPWSLVISMLVLLVYVPYYGHTAAKGGVSRRRRGTAEEQLIADLFRRYDHDARAVLNTSATVTVNIQFLLLRIQKLDERSQVLLTTGLVITEWKDERLTWNPASYGNLTDIVVHADRIWLPELAIINGADDMIQEFEKIRVLISSDGKVHWEPGGVFTTTCDIDITYFPFDQQACPIEIGAWAYKSSRMNLTNLTSEMEMQEFRLNGEWDVTHTDAFWREVVLPCCPDIRYSKVVFTLHMNRRFTFYLLNIILPCVLLSILILIVFCVPPDAGEKISSGISVLLAFTVFLLMLADNVPRTSLDVPILVIYLGVTMGLGTASVCLSVLVLNFHHKGAGSRMPRWARVLFNHNLARLFGFTPPPPRAPAAPPPRPDRRSPRPHPYHLRPHHHNNFTDDSLGGGADDEMVEVVRGTFRSPSGGHRHNKRGGLPVEQMLLKDNMRYHQVDSGARRVEAGGQGEGEKEALEAEDIIKEWQLLAKVLDRLFFIIVFIVILSSALFLLLSPWWGSVESRYATQL